VRLTHAFVSAAEKVTMFLFNDLLVLADAPAPKKKCGARVDANHARAKPTLTRRLRVELEVPITKDVWVQSIPDDDEKERAFQVGRDAGVAALGSRVVPRRLRGRRQQLRSSSPTMTSSGRGCQSSRRSLTR
jgi:hypothetical protein